MYETAPSNTPTPAAPKRTTRTVIAVLAIAVVSWTIGLIMGIAGSSGTAKTTAAPAPATRTITKTVQAPAPVASTVTKTVAPPAAAPPAPKTTIGEGTWIVGQSFAAGDYTAHVLDPTCFWQITRAGSNGQDIVANHIGGGDLKVTLATGQEFTTNRCGTWSKS